MTAPGGGEAADLEPLLEALARSPDLGPFRELVAPLEEHDREKGMDLIATLRAFFASGTNASETADQLFLHRNSLAYRLDRVRELTGLDWRDDRAGLALQLGLLAIEGEEKGWRS